MKINKAFEFRIYPNKFQREFLEQSFGNSRFIFNYFLNKKIKDFENNKTKLEEDKTKISFNNDSKFLTTLKRNEEYIWLNKSSRSSLENSLENLDNAFQNFFKHNKSYPKFKKKSNEQSFQYNCFAEKITIENNKLKIPKLKSFIKIKQHQQFPNNCKFLSLNIKKIPSGKYFAIFNCEIDIQNLPIIDKIIGIDLGIKNFIATSDNLSIINPKYFKKYQGQLIIEQQKLSKKVKGSNNYKKQRIKLARIYEKITNLKKDFMHKLSHKIINENQIIICENLCVKNMLQDKNFSKEIHNVSWSTFTQQLKYKSQFYGRTFHRIDRYFASSKICNCCKFKNVNLTIDQRTWVCSKCSAILERDLNAAKNILEQGIKDLGIGAQFL